MVRCQIPQAPTGTQRNGDAPLAFRSGAQRQDQKERELISFLRSEQPSPHCRVASVGFGEVDKNGRPVCYDMQLDALQGPAEQ